ncbi:unnamed protein product [Acanthoscelides obtectus]|uniref:Uncharacterized protein n=1 Tax=Acanthoscelides obtectus TaxID=200917 RepID=A0A9P0VPM0_ACAOB|nr:unnamed protein product [Acanthoscelides obtectus]CAK1682866.1 hypothetical protein AOBTE_LOCUS33947 [Acanthoscelides obtectus]
MRYYTMGDQEDQRDAKKTNSKRNGNRYSSHPYGRQQDRRRLENCNGKKQILKEILHNIQIINMIEGDLKIVGFN